MERLYQSQQQHLLLSKERVLGREQHLASILLHSDDTSSLVLAASSGRGKTSTLSALAARADVHKRFREGVYLMRLGRNATTAELCECLVDIVEGLRLRRTLARTQQLLARPESAMEGLSALMSSLGPRPILLLFDDVEVGSQAGQSIQHVVKELANREASKSRIVLTTNDSAAAASFPITEMISIETTPKESEEMLCNYAEMSRSDVRGKGPDVESLFDRVLDKCDGLPLSLMIAGRAIREIKNSCSASKDEVWAMYLKKWSNVGRPGGRNRSAIGWLWSAIGLNASLAEQRLQQLRVKDLFRSLCVLPSNRSVPMTTLSCLWGTDLIDAEKAAFMFARLGILSIEHADGTWIRLHELVHNACVKEACKLGSAFIKEAHNRLLDNYYDLLSPPAGKDVTKEWWQPMADCLDGEDDGYLTQNLIRHLADSARIKETLSVLGNYMWTETRVARSRHGGSTRGISEDIKTYLASLPNFSAVDYSDTSETIEDIREGLGYIAEAAQRCETIVAANPSELAFQLYGRLAHRRERSPVVKTFLWTVDLRAEALRRQEKELVEV